MIRAGIPAQRRCPYMRKMFLVSALLLATAATAVAFERCVVLEIAYAEY
jgi:hypothetical protein